MKKDLILVLALTASLALSATLYGLSTNSLIAYGDAESHLNIAKRVTDSVTPGLAQLGGIWLPLPHLLMVPFTHINYLWQTGLAGSIISGIAYIAANIGLFALIFEFTQNRLTAWLGMLVFALNPNVLYIQTTAMTEMPLIAFFILATFFFLKHLRIGSLGNLVLSAAFGLAATLSRYDGWFLVLFQAAILLVWYITKGGFLRNGWLDRFKHNWAETEAKTLTFAFMAFMGIGLWLLWDFLILKDPLYFTNSPFSAKSQQQNWMIRGELPTYGHLWLSFTYYMATSMANIGSILSISSIVGFLLAWLYRPSRLKFVLMILLSVPLIFYTLTLYVGQSVIFIPSLTPSSFEWNLFNVRYGLMMIPAAAVLTALLMEWLYELWIRLGTAIFPGNKRVFAFLQVFATALLLLPVGYQQYRFLTKREPVITYDDGVTGLSSGKSTDAESWIKHEYDGGYVLADDYARTLSIIRARLPMEKVIYVGTKPYWEESLKQPEKYARWIVMQDGDTVWKELYENEAMRGRLYTYFEKAYTSPQILIFKRNDKIVASI